MFILFHQDDNTFKYFYEDAISGDMYFEEFREFGINLGINHVDLSLIIFEMIQFMKDIEIIIPRFIY